MRRPEEIRSNTPVKELVVLWSLFCALIAEVLVLTTSAIVASGAFGNPYEQLLGSKIQDVQRFLEVFRDGSGAWPLPNANGAEP
jgi:hypothetical protein